jgi:hypothetical protein
MAYRQWQRTRRLFDRGESSFGLGHWPAIIAGGLWCFLLYFFGVFSWTPARSINANPPPAAITVRESEE